MTRSLSLLRGALLATAAFTTLQARADVPLHTRVTPPPFHSVHEAQMRQPPLMAPSSRRPAARAPSTLGPDVTVYGYWPYWGDDLSTVPYDSLSHLAIFAASLNSDGTLSSTSYWTNNAAEAVSLAQPYGVRVHLCVTSFDSNVMSSVLASASKRATAISKMQQLVETYGAHGVNIDFEGLPSSQKANFVTFIKELNAAVDDVYLATPAVDWSGAFDYDQLALNSDGLFIMGYGYHWSGGDPGPVGPLYGGSPWGTYALDWTVDDYITYGAPLDRIVLGLPLYGYDWPSTSNTVPGDATGSGVAVTYSSAISQGQAYGRHWDTVTHTPYAFPDGVSQLWYDDLESIEDRIAYAVGENLQGVGFWALTYEDSDPAFWNMVNSLTTVNTCLDTDGDGVDTCNGDCNDEDATVYPGADEACDGMDNNCDGQSDDVDVDGDGVTVCGGDCNDADPTISPLADEVDGDGIDNDCDGIIDEPAVGCGSLSRGVDRTSAHGAWLLGFLGLTGLWERRRRSRTPRG